MKNVVVLAIVLLVGCKTSEISKNVLIEKKRDSISYHVETIRSRPMIQKWTVNDICDSTGIAKGFEQSISIGADSMDLKMVNNEFSFRLSTLDSLRFKSVREFYNGYDFRSEKDAKEVIRNVVPVWCWYSVAANFVFLMALGAWLYCKIGPRII